MIAETGVASYAIGQNPLYKEALAAAAEAGAAGVAIAILSADVEKAKFTVYIAVPAAMEAALDCKAWLAAALAPAGGKGGGGKAGLAQGQSSELDKIDASFAAAAAFVAGK